MGITNPKNKFLWFGQLPLIMVIIQEFELSSSKPRRNGLIQPLSLRKCLNELMVNLGLQWDNEPGVHIAYDKDPVTDNSIVLLKKFLLTF